MRKSGNRGCVKSKNSFSSSSFYGRRTGRSTFHFRQDRLSKQFLSAVGKGDVDGVRSFIEHGLKPEEVDDGVPALSEACNIGNLDIVSLLIDFGTDVNDYGDSALAPIHTAAKRGHDSVLALLLNRGANINASTQSEYRTALHLAALARNDRCIRILIANQAALDSRDIYGSTPLHLAAQTGGLSTVKLLLQHKAEVNAYDKDGWTSLHFAAQNGNVQLAKILRSYNATVDCQNKYGRTPLHCACSSGRDEMVEMLLNQKANANIRDFHEKKPVHYALQQEILKLVRPHTDNDLAPAGSIGASIIELSVKIGPCNDGNEDKDNDNDDGVWLDSPSTTTRTGTDFSFSSCNTSPGSSPVLKEQEGSLWKQTATKEDRLFDKANKTKEDSDTESANLVKKRPTSGTTQMLTGSKNSLNTEVSMLHTKRNSRDQLEDILGTDGAVYDRRPSSLASTFECVLADLTDIITSIGSIEHGLNRAARNPGESNAILKETQSKTQRLLELVSGTQESCRVKLEQCGPSIVVPSRCSEDVSESYSLPITYYNALQLAIGVRIGRNEKEWGAFVKDSDLPDAPLPNDCYSSVDDIGRGFKSLAVMVGIAQDSSSPIKDTINYVGKCNSDDFDKLQIVRDMIDFTGYTASRSQNPNESMDRLGTHLTSSDCYALKSQLGIYLNSSTSEGTKEQLTSHSTDVMGWHSSSSPDIDIYIISLALIETGREDLLHLLLASPRGHDTNA